MTIFVQKSRKIAKKYRIQHMYIPYQPILTALNNLQSNQLHANQSNIAIYTETLHAEFSVSCWDISSSHFSAKKHTVSICSV